MKFSLFECVFAILVCIMTFTIIFATIGYIASYLYSFSYIGFCLGVWIGWKAIVPIWREERIL